MNVGSGIRWLVFYTLLSSGKTHWHSWKCVSGVQLHAKCMLNVYVCVCV